MAPALYFGEVRHTRLRPQRHHLRQRFIWALLPLDGLAALDRSLRLFAVDRPAPVSFWQRDHGDPAEPSPRHWLARLLRPHGIDPFAVPVTVLAQLRILGYVFDPLSVWFIGRDLAAPEALVYEVHNTFQGRHAYVVPLHGQAVTTPHLATKCFFVSPFAPLQGCYRFTLRPPGERLSLAIRYAVDGEDVILASFSGRRQPLNDRSLARLLLTRPHTSLAVTAGIHLEAAKLWAKGVPLFDRPPTGPASASLGMLAPD
jgi:DUF1365 family protein